MLLTSSTATFTGSMDGEVETIPIAKDMNGAKTSSTSGGFIDVCGLGTDGFTSSRWKNCFLPLYIRHLWFRRRLH